MFEVKLVVCGEGEHGNFRDFMGVTNGEIVGAPRRFCANRRRRRVAVSGLAWREAEGNLEIV